MFYKKIPEIKKDVAWAMVKAGKSYREVAGAMRISVSSVHEIAKQPREDLEPLVREIKGRLALKYLLLSDHIIESINDFNMMNASLREKAAAATKMLEKALDLEKDPALSGKETERLPNTGDEA